MMNSLTLVSFIATISIVLGLTCPTSTTSSTFADVSTPFQTIVHPAPPSATWGTLSGPYPTNQFFTNLYLPNNNNKVVVPLPYMMTLSTSGLTVGLPGKSSSSTGVMASYTPNTMLSSVESVRDFTITSYDALSVTAQWAATSGSGTMSTPIVRGSPYATMFYTNMTPSFSTIHAILSVNGGTTRGLLTSNKFVLVFNNGQTWILYAINSQPITLNWSGNGLIGTSAFTGAIRLAEVPTATALPFLDNHSQSIPTGVQMNFYNGSSTENAGYIEFVFKTTGTASNLLILALPHHMDVISSGNAQILGGTFSSIKGAMTGLIGNVWRLREEFTNIQWNAPAGIPSSKKQTIISALNLDKGARGQTLDPYWGGKSFGKMARLALIADELGETATAATIRANMQTDIAPWLSATNTDPLRYDRSWGGIVSANGISDAGADYGNGWYNDHHFHYGYFIYAAAVIAKGNPAWIAANKNAILPLLRDFANPSADSRFPQARHKDWYDGHSWASGLFPFGDAKNQESSSECINAYYGVYLLGLALKDDALTFWGQMLLATETRSVQKYWQITSDSSIYDPVYAANKVVGVLWASKVDYATFFGNQVEFIHGIQMMPYTPYSEVLLRSKWITEEYPVVSSAFTRASPVLTDDWKGFLYMAHAVIAPNTAWNEVQTLNGWDSGNSQTNVLYWVATRPGFTSKRRTVVL